MADKQKLVIVISRGFDDERASVAWSIANASVASDLEVTIFLVAAGVDWVRKGASEVARPNPLDPPIGEMMGNVMSSGGKILVCPPCAKVRGYGEGDLVDGVTIAGAPAMLEVVKQGASTLSF
jgi:predicted peroxiredoxin